MPPKYQKCTHIKNDNSLSTVQKMQEVRAIHQQTDPQMKAILSPEQYQKLKQIRAQAIREATQGTMGRLIDGHRSVAQYRQNRQSHRFVAERAALDAHYRAKNKVRSL